ncbi:hypothetical protein EGW08_022134 [Elysia chlorotica]|uniref:Uncharacterized protein n=1 Tax=Elysia chlorotica TaxID=188477 RepID=A0A3S0ZLF1_ELYCH|nr:hypothetical protein EGW08_022134 [Elysia chlorotica]
MWYDHGSDEDLDTEDGRRESRKEKRRDSRRDRRRESQDSRRESRGSRRSTQDSRRSSQNSQRDSQEIPRESQESHRSSKGGAAMEMLDETYHDPPSGKAAEKRVSEVKKPETLPDEGEHEQEKVPDEKLSAHERKAMPEDESHVESVSSKTHHQDTFGDWESEKGEPMTMTVDESDRRSSFRKKKRQKDDDASDTETLTRHTSETGSDAKSKRKRSDTGEKPRKYVPIEFGVWSLVEKRLVCEHPRLGRLGEPPQIRAQQNVPDWAERRLPCEVLYEDEIYTVCVEWKDEVEDDVSSLQMESSVQETPQPMPAPRSTITRHSHASGVPRESAKKSFKKNR